MDCCSANCKRPSAPEIYVTPAEVLLADKTLALYPQERDSSNCDYHVRLNNGIIFKSDYSTRTPSTSYQYRPSTNRNNVNLLSAEKTIPTEKTLLNPSSTIPFRVQRGLFPQRRLAGEFGSEKFNVYQKEPIAPGYYVTPKKLPSEIENSGVHSPTLSPTLQFRKSVELIQPPPPSYEITEYENMVQHGYRALTPDRVQSFQRANWRLSDKQPSLSQSLSPEPRKSIDLIKPAPPSYEITDSQFLDERSKSAQNFYSPPRKALGIPENPVVYLTPSPTKNIGNPNNLASFNYISHFPNFDLTTPKIDLVKYMNAIASPEDLEALRRRKSAKYGMREKIGQFIPTPIDSLASNLLNSKKLDNFSISPPKPKMNHNQILVSPIKKESSPKKSDSPKKLWDSSPKVDESSPRKKSDGSPKRGKNGESGVLQGNLAKEESPKKGTKNSNLMKYREASFGPIVGNKLPNGATITFENFIDNIPSSARDFPNSESSPSKKKLVGESSPSKTKTSKDTQTLSPKKQNSEAQTQAYFDKKLLGIDEATQTTDRVPNKTPGFNQEAPPITNELLISPVESIRKLSTNETAFGDPIRKKSQNETANESIRKKSDMISNICSVHDSATDDEFKKDPFQGDDYDLQKVEDQSKKFNLVGDRNGQRVNNIHSFYEESINKSKLYSNHHLIDINKLIVPELRAQILKQPEIIIIEGELMKYKPGLHITYVPRWVTVTCKEFRYYKNRWSAGCWNEKPLFKITLEELRAIFRVNMRLPNGVNPDGTMTSSIGKNQTKFYHFELFSNDNIIPYEEEDEDRKNLNSTQLNQSDMRGQSSMLSPSGSHKHIKRDHLMPSPSRHRIEKHVHHNKNEESSIRKVSQDSLAILPEKSKFSTSRKSAASIKTTASIKSSERASHKNHKDGAVYNFGKKIEDLTSWSGRAREWFYSEKRLLFASLSQKEREVWLSVISWLIDRTEDKAQFIHQDKKFCL